MKDRQIDKLIEMLRAGADPRRAAPARIRPRTVVASPSWRSFFTAASIGAALIVAVGGAAALVFDLRPARRADIRLAWAVRAGAPDIDELSAAEIAARVAVPARVGEVLTSLTQSRASDAENSIAALVGQPRLAVDPGRIQALEAFVNRLSEVPVVDRLAVLGTTMEIARALVKPTAADVLHVLSQLPIDELARLHADMQLRQILDQIAGLTPVQRSALLSAGLDSVPTDQRRASLLRDLAGLDPPLVDLLLRWRNSATGTSRQMLMAVLKAIESGDAQFDRLIAAFVGNNRALLTVLHNLPANCSSINVGACR